MERRISQDAKFSYLDDTKIFLKPQEKIINVKWNWCLFPQHKNNLLDMETQRSKSEEKFIRNSFFIHKITMLGLFRWNNFKVIDKKKLSWISIPATETIMWVELLKFGFKEPEFLPQGNLEFQIYCVMCTRKKWTFLLRWWIKPEQILYFHFNVSIGLLCNARSMIHVPRRTWRGGGALRHFDYSDDVHNHCNSVVLPVNLRRRGNALMSTYR